MVVYNNDDDSISLYPVSNTGILSNTGGKGYKGQQIGLQVVILIEKCTHVKGRKNVLLRKIKWRKRCLNGISVLLRNIMYIQN